MRTLEELAKYWLCKSVGLGRIVIAFLEDAEAYGYNRSEAYKQLLKTTEEIGYCKEYIQETDATLKALSIIPPWYGRG